VHRHIAACREMLTEAEIRAILARRFAGEGRELYRTGKVLRGGWRLAQALVHGADRGEILWYFLTASPPARGLKRLLGRGPKVHDEPAVRRPGGSLLGPAKQDLAAVPGGPPILIATIDAEAEFDWDGPFLRTHTRVENLRHQHLAQEVFDRFGVRPTYFVDYAVASQPKGYEPLRQILARGRCEIGAHLQAWETPPFEEELSERTSYNHNLPAWLQKEKLTRLTEMIGANFGMRPVVYRAGRWGVGEETAWILQSLGYQIDMSVRPCYDLSRSHGPDFRRAPERPYWFGANGTLLEIPATAAFVSLLSAVGRAETFAARLYASLTRVRTAGLFARLGLLERIFLGPEGISVGEMRRLTRALLSRGCRVFVFSYHSSSLLPGSTSYVRSAKDLAGFLRTIEAYLEFFFGEIGGQAMTPTELRAMLARAGASAPAAAPLAMAAK
jgi:peptidoglycan/xylan/chitin deacetylase (PgdA/CDA1 family)